MTLTPRFSEALRYAANLHAAQQRKISGEPYLAHLLATAAIVMEHGGDEDEAIAALLHDAVEDQGGKPALEEIRRCFGPRVAEIVAGCSDADETPKPPWRGRKEAHIARLCDASASIRLVAAADKLHNAQSLLRDYCRHGPAIWEKFHGGRDGTLWYYRAVAETLRKSGNSPLVDELHRTVSELENRKCSRGYIERPQNSSGSEKASVERTPSGA